jgi:hypothetical protein
VRNWCVLYYIRKPSSRIFLSFRLRQPFCDKHLDLITFSFRLNANLFALFLRLKSVLVTLATSVPEPRAATVISIVEPLDSEVPAGASVLLQTTCRAWHHRYRETTLKVLALSLLDSIRTASELRRVAGASGKVGPSSRRSAIRTALVFGTLASAAC